MTQAQSKQHWEQVYTTKSPAAVSWYQQRAHCSLRLIEDTGLLHSGAIIDVGGGAATLVDDLLTSGGARVTVLDWSAAALAAARQRLGARAAEVQWLEADITKVELPECAYDIWHDRAVFHFLTAAADRSAYVQALCRALQPGGHVIIATFAADGPTQCSGLPVVRYGAAELQAQLGAQFTLQRHELQAHHTPFGSVQQFIYCHFRRSAA